MLEDVKWARSGQYNNYGENTAYSFFSEALFNSNKFDLLLGYFSSSSISALARPFSAFLANGGKMRMIMNSYLFKKDKKAVEEGLLKINQIDEFDLKDLDKLEKTLSSRDRHFFECLSWLISRDRLEIKVVEVGNEGLPHSKEGLFSDGKDEIYFGGSCNFTASAILLNAENIGISWSWDGEKDKAAIKDFKKNFEEIWNNENKFFSEIKISNIKEKISNIFPARKLSQLLKQGKELIEEEIEDKLEKRQIKINDKIINQLKEDQKKIDKMIEEQAKKEDKENENSIRLPVEELREYQQKAYLNWRENGKKGLFSMCTGSGKTITALNCLLQETLENKGIYKAIILVPSEQLANQWKKECESFNFKNIYVVLGSNAIRKVVRPLIREEKENVSGLSYILITTYSSYSIDQNFKILNELNPEELVFVADEAHKLGSPEMLSLIPNIQAKKRIGLSATPERAFDEEGINEKVLDFFNSVDQPTFEFTMKEGIEKGVLCRYYYYPKIVNLTEEEMEEYKDLTKKIIKSKNSQKEKGKQVAYKILLQKRKNIINRAENKILKFKEIINEIGQEEGKLSDCIVFVPEGKDRNSEEAEKIIDQFTRIVKDSDESVLVRKYVADTENRDKILEEFANGKINVITSMKCLDEGADIKSARIAIICASTEEPRQYIQRRGRVLRNYPGKIAKIYDLIVVPPNEGGDETSNQERNLVKKELRRVFNFSKLSENPLSTSEGIRPLMREYSLLTEDILK